MLISMPGRDQSTEAWSAETFSALARTPVDGPDPVVWPFTPYYTGNPFQSVLYSRFTARNLVAVPTFRATDLITTTRGWPGDVPLVVHLHWLNQVLARAGDDRAANQAVDRHTELLDTLRERGARLVWTVHNVLPHDTRFEAQEVRLREQVVERADLVHVMSPRTPEAVGDWFELPPEKVYRCDHPGYQGVYPDWVSRAEARRRLRIDDGAVALLLTGAVKPYKGIADLLEAVDRVSRARPGRIVLIVAGKPDDAPETRDFVAAAAAHPAVRLLPAQVPDADIQVLMRAADLVALPYRRSLNSGVLALALTFGRPVLLPSNSGSLPVVEGGAALVYRPDGVGALTEAVFGCLEADFAALDRAAAAAGRRIDRTVVSERFAADMRAWADTGVVPGSAPVAEISVDLGPLSGVAAGIPPGAGG
ncbi:glycosyltransferase [Kineosporia sp. J2-2]|uniref:Glycosyltransferase n=1 Tax=Kineosporia corallincola TaxID=2835133 RepID=A0ABS5TJH0_9ACTN|nr:glycosyltransferase [Kineosporia corallincola]MBT0770351.1 glycosyltransferase [Kineosporia corallincola]